MFCGFRGKRNVVVKVAPAIVYIPSIWTLSVDELSGIELSDVGRYGSEHMIGGEVSKCFRYGLGVLTWLSLV